MVTIQEPDAETLEALYNINKHAKKYKRLAEENYRKGKKGTARANSLKKGALYGVKDSVIDALLRDAPETVAEIERHPINGDPFLCFRFEVDGRTWSFHQPEANVPRRRLPDTVEIVDRDAEEFEEFESAEEKAHSDLSLKASLLHLEAVGVDANNHLEETHVTYGWRQVFAGWSYLGDGGERIEEVTADPPPEDAAPSGDVEAESPDPRGEE